MRACTELAKKVIVVAALLHAPNVAAVLSQLNTRRVDVGEVRLARLPAHVPHSTAVYH